jgi:hypothetical protein
MKNLNPILKLAPEIYLILASLFYWASTASILNPIAIVLLIILVFQVIFKINFTGLLLAITFLMLNVYMCFALASELHEFTSPTENYWKMLIVGTLFFGFNLSMSILMFGKYLRNLFSTPEK